MSVRALPAAVAAFLVAPLLVALPVLSAPAANAVPVAPTVREMPVTAAKPAGPATTSSVSALRMSGVDPSSVLLSSAAQDVAGFATVGASWAQGTMTSATRVEFRVRTAGAWGSWTELEALDTAADDGSLDAAGQAARTGGRVVAEPIYVGASDGVQTRVRSVGAGAAVPTALRLTLVDPGTSAADSAVTRGAPLAAAHAATGRPEIYSRAQWGADESLRSYSSSSCTTPSYSNTIKVGFVHHTDTGNDYTADEVPGIIRSIYAYHVKSNGWCDIGYNFLTDRFGRIWEGRAGGVDKAVIGAHTGGFNTESFAMSMIGNFTSVAPSSAMIDAYGRLFAWKLGMYYRDPKGTGTLISAGGGGARWPAGTAHDFDTISGHRDAGYTTCPGDAAYALMPQIRDATLAAMPTGFVNPAVTSRPADANDTGSATVAAGALAPTAWRLVVTGPTGAVVTQVDAPAPTSTVSAAWNLTDPATGSRARAGTYRLTLTGSGNELPYSASTVVGRPPIGSLDEVARGVDGDSSSSVVVRGWGLDPDTAAPVTVQVLVDGSVLATTAASEDRPDIGAAFPGYGNAHGYRITVSAPNGGHRVCVNGLDNDTGQPTEIGCRDAFFGATPDPAVGALESVTRVPGGVRVVGWADDPNSSGPATVAVTGGGALLATGSASGERPDRTSATRTGRSATGVDLTAPLGAGATTVCLDVRLGGSAARTTSLGCQPVTVLAGSDAGGALDGFTASSDGSSVRLRGWTIDPDTAASTQMHVYVDTTGTAFVADGSRPDVGAAFPGYGAVHGYDVTVPIGPGRHRICAYAINAAGPGGNTQLGCRMVGVAGGSPIGALDQVTRTGDGRVRVRGWAVDGDTAGSIPVHVYVGGTGTALTADGQRPDVQQAFSLPNGAHGYDGLLAVPASPVTVCAYGINTGPGSNVQLGCRSV